MAMYRGYKDENGEKLIEFKGRVLGHERVILDEYEVLVKRDDGTFDYVGYASNSFPTYDHWATADAAPEIVAEYEGIQRRARERAWALERDIEARIPLKGRLAIVTQGRGKTTQHVGKVGRITWVGFNKYAPRNTYEFGYDKARTKRLSVRIQPDEGEAFFVVANNIDVITEPIEEEVAA